MSEDLYRGSLSSEGGKPSRIEILRGSGGQNPYFKKGQFAFVVGVNTTGGVYPSDKDGAEPTEPGEVAFLVSKTPDMRGGALWFSADAMRFTKPPADLLKALSAEERVALDLFLTGNGSYKGQTTVAELVPDKERRGYVKMLASQIRSLRAR